MHNLYHQNAVLQVSVQHVCVHFEASLSLCDSVISLFQIFAAYYHDNYYKPQRLQWDTGKAQEQRKSVYFVFVLNHVCI